MINAIRLIAPVILTSFMLVSADTKRDNHFLGKWEIDVQKTLTSNDLPYGREDLYQMEYIFTPFKQGNIG